MVALSPSLFHPTFSLFRLKRYGFPSQKLPDPGLRSAERFGHFFSSITGRLEDPHLQEQARVSASSLHTFLLLQQISPEASSFYK